jgi:hypothetical protein
MDKKIIDIAWSNISGLLIIKKKDDQVLPLVYGIHIRSNMIKSTMQISIFLYNIKTSYKSVLMEDTRSNASHDG